MGPVELRENRAPAPDGHLLARYNLGDEMDIISAERAFRILKKLMHADVEEFWALALGPRKELLRAAMLFRGTVDECRVHPRDIFRFAVRENASSLLLAHNHPSRDPEPSPQDLLLTEALLFAADVFEIAIVDHLIITQETFTSLARGRRCDFTPGLRRRHFRADASVRWDQTKRR